MKTRDILAVFNRGRISRLALGRTDVSRVALSASIQTNWMPRTLGSMMLRPGLEYHGANPDDGANIPFIFDNSDTAILELSPSVMRVWNDGDTLLTRASVSSAIANGNFTTDLASWTDADDSGATSTWVAGEMQLLGTGYASARRQQQVSVVLADEDVVHALRIVVSKGPLLLRIGTTAGDDDIFRQAVLRTGTHSIAFTPGASSFYIEFSSSLTYPVLIDSVAVEASGTVELPTPWTDATTCKLVRWYQSSDVVFCACEGIQQRRIERRPNGSWSVVLFQSDDGPFLTENVDNIRITPSAITGAITMTASRSIWRSGHVGALYKLSSQGQLVASSLAAELTYTNPIRVTGVTSGRIFSVIRAGTWAGTLTLQRSIGEPGAWVDVATYTANGTTSYDDGLDNSIAYYRIGFNAGDYTSGTADASLEYAVGSITGVVRITGFTSATSVSADVITDLGGTAATEIWAEGAWSDVEGWPMATGIWEGRNWWSGNGRNYGSVSDAFTSYDPETVGDAGPINRRIGEGSVDKVNWLLPLQRLVAGTDGAEHTVRSTSFDEPITPSNYNTKAPSTKGSAEVPAVSTDGRGYFVGKTTKRVYELEYDLQKYDYSATDQTLLVPEIGDGGFIRIAVQQNPDIRLHCARADGTVGVLVRDAAEDVLCWVDVETDGFVEDVVVLPGTTEDRVFYRVRRTINGVTVRYHEEWAREDEARGGTLNKQADSFITGAGDVTGLSHLEGETVVVWADGVDQGEFSVSGGAIGQSFTTWCAGLGYTGQYQSAKLAGQTQMGLSLTQTTRINQIGLVLADTHARGLKYGPSFDVLDDLPLVEDGAIVDGDTIWESYDKDMVEFPGEWSTDNRVCLQAAAPRPCTVLVAVLNVDRQDKA